jgi:hypothetical protein
MKEGAWINVATGRYEWITEHCDWMKNSMNAKKIGLPDNVFETIKDMPNDYQGPKRKQILLTIMDAGFIRLRGHGSYIAIEFTVSTKKALSACEPLLKQVCGPLTLLRFNNLSTNENVEATYREVEVRVRGAN